jgi:hypothetical protein
MVCCCIHVVVNRNRVLHTSDTYTMRVIDNTTFTILFISHANLLPVGLLSRRKLMTVAQLWKSGPLYRF